MKVSYPLSLKVSLWLMLNLLLLAALGVGFFLVQGGLGWSALIAGPTGDRAQAKINIIAAEVAAATPANRNTVLDRFKAAYGAEFFVFRGPEGQVAGAPVELPANVQSRIDAFRSASRWMPFNRDFGPSGGRGPRGEFGPPPDGSPRGPRERSDKEGPRRESPPDSLRPPEHSGPPERKTEPPPERGRERELGRFIVRTGAPARYWLAMRGPFFAAERGRPGPALLVARIDSFWSLLRFLDLESWVLAGTGVLALSVLFWLPLVRSITHSVGQLTTATEQIARGHFETRVDTGRRDELGQLGESVNRMASRLDAHMTGQKRFLGDVAHELCSPLARLQMATGILADQAPPNLRETVADVREEVQQMSTLVNELLAFTKAGLQSRDVVLRATAIETVVHDALARENAGDRVTTSIHPGLTALADPDLLGRAIGNLVRNALRYAAGAGPITVTATTEAGRVVILVEDEGPGVPVTDLDRLGEPFFRPELARTRESGGVGLGLAIVRNSIAACAGEVRFVNRTPRGFRAEVRLAAA